METFTAEGKEKKQYFLSETNLGLWHCVYQNNCYNNMAISGSFLFRSVRVCGTITANRGLPADLLTIGRH
jgi:hypothetical protein